jgi:nucleotide-binding universal stress UspA family protein
MHRTLVFGDDQSQSADVAWLWVNCHSWPDWHVEVITATPEHGVEATDPEPWDPPHPRRILDSAHEATVVHERVRADPRTAFAALRGRDLLVVGPKGRGVGRALHLGSTSERLMHDPPVPLVIARKGQATSRVLICADGSDHCRSAVTAFLAMPWIAQTEVRVVSIPERGVDPEDAIRAVSDLLGDAPGSVRGEVLAPDPLQVSYQVRGMLLDHAHEWDADLIVLGSRGLSGLAALRAGSVAASLAAHAHCSMLMATER